MSLFLLARRGRPLLVSIAAVLGTATTACRGSDGIGPGPTVDVGSVTIETPSFQIERGFHQALTAVVRNKAGDTVSVPVVWRSSNDAVATIDANGRLIAVDTGTVGVVASTLGVISAPIGVRVVWQGAFKIAPYQFTAPSAATPSTTVPDSIRVVVTDRAGSPVPNARVSFTPVAGGTVAPTIAITGPNGVAAAQWVLGPTFGANTVVASAVNDDDKPLSFVQASPVTFAVTTFRALTPVQGDAQTGQILSTLPVAPSVRLVDAAGNPRAGVPVTFSATSNGRVATSTVSTGADGVVSPGSWTLGDLPGDQMLVARVEAATLALHATGTGTPVHFMPSLVTAGGFATCAVLTDGTGACFGEQPKVGDGTSTNRSTPTATAGSARFARIVGSSTHFCGIGTNQALYCWGVNALTDTSGATTRADLPTAFPGTRTWSQAAPGAAHNCALETSGTVFCWGDNTVGQLGDATTARRFSAAPVAGGFTFAKLASGSNHSCALTSDGSPYCWGANASGQLGDGSTANRLTPTAVAGGVKFQSIGGGDAWTCGLSTAGRAYCWGDLFQGTPQTTPKEYASAPAFTTLAVGGGHACGLTAEGTAYCWGANGSGQVGDTTTSGRQAPVAVAGGLKFRSISAGYAHTCGQTSDGSVACWGLNRAGELGNNTISFSSTPRYVVLGVNP